MKNSFLYLLNISFYLVFLFNKGQAQCDKRMKCGIINMDEFANSLDIPKYQHNLFYPLKIYKGENGNFYINKNSSLVRKIENTDIFCQIEKKLPILKIRTCPQKSECKDFEFKLDIGEKYILIIIVDSEDYQIFKYRRSRLSKRPKNKK